MLNRKITNGIALMTIKNVSMTPTASFKSSGRFFKNAFVAVNTYPISSVNASTMLVASARISAEFVKYGVCRSSSMAYIAHTKKARIDWNGESLAMMQNNPVRVNLNSRTNTSKYQNSPSSVFVRGEKRGGKKKHDREKERLKEVRTTIQR